MYDVTNYFFCDVRIQTLMIIEIVEDDMKLTTKKKKYFNCKICDYNIIFRNYLES